jgi:hypothetical protein
MKNEKKKFDHYNYGIGFYADFCLAFSLGGESPAISMGGRCYRRWSGYCRKRVVEQLFICTSADTGGIPVCEPTSSQILSATEVSKKLGSRKKMGSESQ